MCILNEKAKVIILIGLGNFLLHKFSKIGKNVVFALHDDTEKVHMAWFFVAMCTLRFVFEMLSLCYFFVVFFCFFAGVAVVALSLAGFSMPTSSTSKTRALKGLICGPAWRSP